MKKIYLSIIILLFILALFFISISFYPNYGSTVRIVKNVLKQNDYISFNSAYGPTVRIVENGLKQNDCISFDSTTEINSIECNYYSGIGKGFVLFQCNKLKKDRDTDKAINYAFNQIQNNKLKGQVYLTNLGKNIKWYSKSNELHVANWVKVWTNYEVEPEDPSFNF